MLKHIDVSLSENALHIFDIYRQQEPHDLEAGGILLGQVSKDETTILIQRVSLPGPYDVATRTTFRRDKVWAQGIAEYEFVNSGGRAIYLGEWHTHPAKRAHPSSRDRAMISEQFCNNELQIPLVLLVIVALNEILIGFYDGKRLWCRNKRFVGSPLSST